MRYRPLFPNTKHQLSAIQIRAGEVSSRRAFKIYASNQPCWRTWRFGLCSPPWLMQPSNVCFTLAFHALTTLEGRRTADPPITLQSNREDPLYCHPADAHRVVEPRHVIRAAKLYRDPFHRAQKKRGLGSPSGLLGGARLISSRLSLRPLLARPRIPLWSRPGQARHQ
jgi:hypothetical protein